MRVIWDAARPQSLRCRSGPSGRAGGWTLEEICTGMPPNDADQHPWALQLQISLTPPDRA